MRTSLFIYESNKEKIAAVELEEDTSQWPRQVLVELYRVLPDTADYSPEVKFMQIDEEQGFGIGVVILSSTTNSALGTSEVLSPRKALVPIVIKNHALCSLDLLMSAKGKLLPLTEDRLREALYRPETFDLITSDWDDTSLWQMFFPPGRSDGSFGSGSTQNPGGFMVGGMGKTSSAKFELLEALGGTIFEQDVDAVTAALSDPAFFKVAAENKTFLGALHHLAELKSVSTRTTRRRSTRSTRARSCSSASIPARASTA
jgi:hypothetical protein